MGLLLLKSRAVGLDCKLVYILGKPVQDRVLDNYFWQIASTQVTFVPEFLFQTFDYFSNHVPAKLLIFLYIKFRFCETFIVINSVTTMLLIKALHKFRTIKC